MTLISFSFSLVLTSDIFDLLILQIAGSDVMLYHELGNGSHSIVVLPHGNQARAFHIPTYLVGGIQTKAKLKRNGERDMGKITFKTLSTPCQAPNGFRGLKEFDNTVDWLAFTRSAFLQA